MRTATTIILTIIWTTILYAECDDEMNFTVFPKKQIIFQNSIFVISGNGYHWKSILKEFGETSNPYLISGNSKIKLIKIEYYEGEFNVSQAILVPETKLEIGKYYTLFLDRLSSQGHLERYNDFTGKKEPITFFIKQGKDTLAPSVIRKPKMKNKTFTWEGKYITFDFPIIDSSEVIIKTTVKCLKTGKSTTFYIESFDKKIDVGYFGECGGAFTFDCWNKYNVKFIFVDSSGNKTDWKWKEITFTKPKKWKIT